MTIETYNILYNIYKENLLPVNKLINKIELTEILETYRFNGKLYSIPFLIFVNSDFDGIFKINDTIIAEINIEEIYDIDFEFTVEKIFGTSDITHPGVNDFLKNKNKKVLAGTIKYLNTDYFKKIPYIDGTINEYVFQSRNPPSAAHELIVSKYAPNLTYTTPYSTVKSTDYPFNKKIKCLEKIKDIYKVDILTTTLPRLLAGPREALFNILYFANKGAKYFIMGRGKNCVGDFYDELEPLRFCEQFQEELGIKILYQEKIIKNNTELKASNIKKDYIDKKIKPPKEFMSEYISEILI